MGNLRENDAIICENKWETLGADLQIRKPENKACSSALSKRPDSPSMHNSKRYGDSGSVLFVGRRCPQEKHLVVFQRILALSISWLRKSSFHQILVSNVFGLAFHRPNPS